MKKQLTLLFVLTFFFSLSFISAFEFDNVKQYDSEKEIIEIRNSVLGIPFLSLDRVATLKLLTPRHNVVWGSGYQRVAEIQIDSEDNYNEAIKYIDFYKTKWGLEKLNDKNYDYKYKSYVDKERPIYREECSIDEKADNKSQICSLVDTGEKEVYQEEVWRDLNTSMPLQKGSIIIGVYYDDVKAGEVIEWIPRDWFGVDIPEWATFEGAVLMEEQKIGADDYLSPTGTNVLGQQFMVSKGNFTLKGFSLFMFDSTGSAESINLSLVSDSGDTLGTTLVSNITIDTTSLPTGAGVGDGVWFNITMPDYNMVNGTKYWIKMYDGVGNTNRWVADVTASGYPYKFYASYAGGYQVQKAFFFQVWGTYPSAAGNITTLLNSPATLYTSSNNNITFNATSVVTGTANLTNATLYIWNTTSLYYINTTNVASTISINNTWNVTNIADGNYEWNVLSCGINASAFVICNFGTNRSFTIDTTSPIVNIYYPTGTINGLTNGQSLQLNYSVIHPAGAVSACWRDYNGVNTTIASCANTTFTYVSGVNTIRVWSNDTFNNVGYDDNTWEADVNINSVSFNTSTYETEYESFVLNATNMSMAVLNYDGTEYTATISGQLATRSIYVPSNAGNKSFYWKINNGLFNSSTYYQDVSSISFALCNATNNIPYLNITFADELTSNAINGTLSPLSLTYYLSSTSSYKTYSLTNTTTINTNYALCFTPSYKNLNVNITATSSMTDYATRNWISNYVLSNTTTNKIVYLLANVDGIYQNVIVSNSAGTTLQNALVTASTGSLGIVATGTTDSGGAVSLWLDPNKAHTLTTSLSGYPTDSRVINPSSAATVYVTLGGTSTYPANLTAPSTEGIIYSIQPNTTSLYNNTAYNFKFIVTSNTLTITNFRFDLYNSSNSIVLSDTSSSNGGTLTQSYNVGNNTKITMRAYYTVNGTITSLFRTWNVINTDDTQYSIFFFKNRVITYLDSGFFGLTRGFGMNLFCFIIIFITVGVFSWKYGINNDIMIASMTLFLVWLFEFALGLIYVSSVVPITFWVALIVIGLLIKEGLKVI